VVAHRRKGGRGPGHLHRGGTGPRSYRPAGLEVLGDSAYGTGEARAALAAAGHTAVIKPAPLGPATAGGFTPDDFTVDEAAGTVTCPNHITRRIAAAGSSPSAWPAGAAPASRVHPRQDRPQPKVHPPGRVPAPGTPRLGTPTRPARHLPATPAHGRTLHCLADRPPKAAAASCATTGGTPTTGGYTPAWPRSSCAAWSTSASPISTEPGHSPRPADRHGNRHMLFLKWGR
jgi:hypothetical protein